MIDTLPAIEFDATVDIQAADGADPTFTMTCYRGGLLKLGGFPAPVVVDLAGLDGTERELPLLLDHKTDKPIGQVDDVRVTAEAVTASGRLNVPGDDRERVVQAAKRGFRWQCSIGVSVEKRTNLQPNATTFVNGRPFNGPVVIVERGRLREVSIVTVGADPSTAVDIAAQANLSGDNDVKTDAQTALLDEINTRRETLQVLAKYKLNEDKRLDLQAAAVENEWSADRLELEALRASRPVVGVTAMRTDGVNQDDVLAAGLAMAMGVSEDLIAAEDGERVAEAARKSEAAKGLRGFVTDFGRARGRHITASEAADIGSLRELDVQASGFSTVGLSGILGNAINKSLLSAFNAAAPAILEIADSSMPLADFKAHSRYRLSANGELEKLGAGGELKHATLSEESYSIQGDTYGKMLVLTRQMLRNDDLGAFAGLIAEFGQMGAKTIDAVGTQVLTDASVGASGFFKTSRNYLTGAGSALSIDALTDAMALFDTQTEPDGSPITVTPGVLFVGPALRTMAHQLIHTLELENVGATDTTNLATRNPFYEQFRVVVSRYLGNANGYSDGSIETDAWYLCSEPGTQSALEISFLDGRRAPTVEQSEASFNTLGMGWRAYLDFGAALRDYRGGVKADGE